MRIPPITILLLPLAAACAAEPRREAAPPPAASAQVDSGALPPVRDLGALRFSAETTVTGEAPRHLRTVVTGTNTGRRRVELQWGNCALRLHAYRTPARTGPPVWRSERRAPPWQEKREGLGSGYVCLAYLAHGTVAPGETFSPKEFTATIPVYEILGDSLPDGRYFFTAELELVRDRPNAAGLDGDTVRLPAGDAHLTARVEPIASARTGDGVRYEARTEPVPGQPDLLRLSITATNVGREPRTVAASPSVDCPVSLTGYRTREERDRWFLRMDADWRGPGRCVLRIPPTRLAPGASRTFQGDFRAPYPDRGPFFLNAILWLQGGDPGTARVVVAAGDTG